MNGREEDFEFRKVERKRDFLQADAVVVVEVGKTDAENRMVEEWIEYTRRRVTLTPINFYAIIVYFTEIFQKKVNKKNFRKIP